MKKRRILSIALILALLISLSLYGSAGSLSSISGNSATRLKQVFNEKILEMVSQDAELYEGDFPLQLQISEIKKVYDMAGNLYILAECSPSGYMIYHNQSGIFVESAVRAQSPYIGIYNGLYYLGPGLYFVCDESKSGYKNLMSGEVKTKDFFNEAAKTSNIINKRLIEQKNTYVLDYVAGECSDSTFHEVSQQSAVSNGITYVPNREFFRDLKGWGQNNTGTCGYLAAGILLAYQQATYGGNFVDYKQGYLEYEYNSCGVSNYKLGNGLHQELVRIGADLGYSNGTTSREIRFTVNEYLARRNVSVNYIDDWVPLASNARIAELIDNDRPVIWLGEIFSNSFNDMQFILHAVVVYGYTYSILSGYSYVAHFGWGDGSNAVTFTGVLGSMYSFTV